MLAFIKKHGAASLALDKERKETPGNSPRKCETEDDDALADGGAEIARGAEQNE